MSKSVALLAQIGQAPETGKCHMSESLELFTQVHQAHKSKLRGQLFTLIYNIISRGPLQNLSFGWLMSRISITLSQSD